MLTNDEKELLRKAIALGTFGPGPVDVTLATIATMNDDDIRLKLNEYKTAKITEITSQLSQFNIFATNLQNELQSLQN